MRATLISLRLANLHAEMIVEPGEMRAVQQGDVVRAAVRVPSQDGVDVRERVAARQERSAHPGISALRHGGLPFSILALALLHLIGGRALQTGVEVAQRLVPLSRELDLLLFVEGPQSGSIALQIDHVDGVK